MIYSLSKPRMWTANSVEICDWWKLRAEVTLTPAVNRAGNTVVASADISGDSDPETAIELVIRVWNQATVGAIEVLLDGSMASPDSYRQASYGIKVNVGSGTKRLAVR
jgi:hypothetical protein